MQPSMANRLTDSGRCQSPVPAGQEPEEEMESRQYEDTDVLRM